MSQLAALVQIGQLLTRSGLLSDEDLASALIRSRERGLPIGTVLLTMGCLRKGDLRAAVEAQSMVNDGLLTAEIAASVLAHVASHGSSFEESLTTLGIPVKLRSHPNRLGQLLIDSGLIDEGQLEECLAMSMETGMPLGRVLAFKKFVSDENLVAGLKAQRMIREGSITREVGLQALRGVKNRRVPIENELVDSGVFRAPKRNKSVGYLLVEAGIVSELQLMTCVEGSMARGKPIIENIIAEGLTTPEVARGCLLAEQLVEAGTLTPRVGAKALKLIVSENYSKERAIAAAGMPVLNDDRKQLLLELLVLSGTISSEQVAEMEADEYPGFDELAAHLDGSGRTTSAMTDALARAIYLIDTKVLLAEDAVMALHYARKSGESLDEALTAMGWKMSTR